MSDNLYKPVEKNGRFENPMEWSTDEIERQGYTKWQIPDKLEFMKKIKFGSMHVDNSNIPGMTSKEDSSELDRTLPINKDDFIKLKNLPKDGIQAMWIGHASMIVQFDGVTILTDPVFSYRCSPVQWKGVGCPRYREAACQVSDLPQIDAVIISHDHYDHLDFNSIKELDKRFGDKLYWFVPKGLKSWFQTGSVWKAIRMGLNCKNVTEMTWWDEQKLPFGNEITFICTPAQHWCQRGLNDMNKRLWCSWIVKSSRYKFYFAGDTGYCPAFKQIGQMYGPFNVAALPIGAYEPRDYMKPQHVSPEQAVMIFQDINRLPNRNTAIVQEPDSFRTVNDDSSKHKFIGIHWGTFKQLGCYENYLEPPKLVKETMRNVGLSEDCFLQLGHGDVVTVQ